MLEAVVDVHLPGVDPGHSAFQTARAELLDDLGATPSLRARERDVPASDGSKGTLIELVISVSASGGIASLVKIVRLWLSRDRRRSLKVTIQTTGTQTTYEVSGDDISVETLHAALEAAARTKGG